MEDTIASFLVLSLSQDRRPCLGILVSPAFAFLYFIEAGGGEGPGEAEEGSGRERGTRKARKGAAR